MGQKICEKCYKIPADVPVCNPPARSIFYAKKGQANKSLKTGYDAHFVPVGGPKYQACDPDVAQYYELVSKPDLVLPLGVLWMEKTAASPSTAVPVTPEVAPQLS